MITTEKTTNSLLEIIKTLPKEKYNQLYDFAMFLTYQTEIAKKNVFYTYIDKHKEKDTSFESELTEKDIKVCFGLWQDRDITKESLRKKAWRNGK